MKSGEFIRMHLGNNPLSCLKFSNCIIEFLFCTFSDLQLNIIYMKKILFLIAVVFCISFFTSQNSYSQSLGFYIANNTGVTLNNIYVTPAESDNWGDDILPQDLFNDQTTVMVYIPESYGETCMFDIKITDLEGNSVTFTNVDACALHTLRINWDGTFEVINE